MKISIIYDSLYGNTEKIAQTIKEVLEKKHEIDIKNVTEAKLKDFQEKDLVIIGSPTHTGRPSKAMQVLLNMLPKESLKGSKLAVFDTSMATYKQNFFMKGVIKFFGYSAPRMANMFKKKGAEIVSVQSFFVLNMKGPLKDDELERAKKWAKGLV